MGTYHKRAARYWLKHGGSQARHVRRQFIDWLKAIPCFDCGRCFPPECMDFDHVRGEKKFQIAHITRGWAKIEEELQKCDLVCANCHRTRTRNRKKGRSE